MTALIGGMVALGLAERGDDDMFRLSAAGAPLAPDHPDLVAAIVAKEWFFYRAWAGLPETVRDGHAQIAPWTERLDADPGTSLAFLGALDDLGARFGGELPGLADLPAPGRVLDVGGGSGIHAAALVAAYSGLEVTVLDLEPVEGSARPAPRAELRRGGPARDRFGRPADETWDVVLVANILHDLPAAGARRIVAEAAGLLREGGALVVYEWILDETRDGPPATALFALMMMVENEGGAAYTESEIHEWMGEAGLAFIETRRGHGPIAAVRGWKP